MRHGIAICDALDSIHRNGVVPPDLQPDKIMIGPEDQIKLMAFGIASQKGASRDSRSGIYALGVPLYELVTGKTPFAAPNGFAIMNGRLLNNLVPPPQANPEIPPELQDVIYRAVEREPRNRDSTANEFACGLERLH